MASTRRMRRGARAAWPADAAADAVGKLSSSGADETELEFARSHLRRARRNCASRSRVRRERARRHCGARMICALVRAGKRVGVTANSHKAIRTPARRRRRKRQRGSASSFASGTRTATSAGAEDERRAYLRSRGTKTRSARCEIGEINVLGGTSWLWARAGMRRRASTCCSWTKRGRCRSPTPSPCRRPRTASCSSAIRSSSSSRAREATPTASAYRRSSTFSARHERFRADRGIFLPITWRLSPRICEFTSEQFYDGRLVVAPRARSASDSSASTVCPRAGLVVVGRRPRRQPERFRRRGRGGCANRRSGCIGGATMDRRRRRHDESDRRTGRSRRRAVQRPGHATVGAARAERASVSEPSTSFRGRRRRSSSTRWRRRAPKTRRAGWSFSTASNRLNVATSRAQVPRHRRGVPVAVRAGVSKSATDEAGERALPLPRDGGADRPRRDELSFSRPGSVAEQPSERSARQHVTGHVEDDGRAGRFLADPFQPLDVQGVHREDIAVRYVAFRRARPAV